MDIPRGLKRIAALRRPPVMLEIVLQYRPRSVVARTGPACRWRQRMPDLRTDEVALARGEEEGPEPDVF
jgi:hypothetical protein